MELVFFSRYLMRECYHHDSLMQYSTFHHFFCRILRGLCTACCSINTVVLPFCRSRSHGGQRPHPSNLKKFAPYCCSCIAKNQRHNVLTIRTIKTTPRQRDESKKNRKQFSYAAGNIPTFSVFLLRHCAGIFLWSSRFWCVVCMLL